MSNVYANIPQAYIIPKPLLEEYIKCIEEEFPAKPTGRRRIDSHALIAGIYYLLKTGCQWGALPLCFGSSKTIWHRLKELTEKNIFQKIWKSELMRYDLKKGLEVDHLSVDTCHKKAPIGGKRTGPSPVDRRKQGIKLGVIVEGKGLPVALIAARGNRNDQKLLNPLLDNLPKQIRQSGTCYLHGDGGFDCATNRKGLVGRGFAAVIPLRKPKNKPRILQEKDTKRWVVERTFSWINRFRRVFICYERKADHFLSLVQMAFQMLIFRNI